MNPIKARKIKDTDFLTATMRIRSQEKYLMDKERAGRLIDARSDDEAIKVLGECGYGEMQALSNDELDRVLRGFREDLYAQLQEMLPVPELLDVFRARYDYHNVKALLKSPGGEEDGKGLLVSSGRVPPAELLRAFKELDFKELPPPLPEAVPEARELLARTGDPQKADFLLDLACLAEMLSLARKTKSAFLIAYVRLYIDIQNLRALVRARRIGKDAQFLRPALAPGGRVGAEGILVCLQEGRPIAEAYAQSDLSGAAEEGEKAARGDAGLTEFEKICDDLLLEKAEKTRYVPFGEQPVLAFLLFREAEMTMIRTVVSGRMAGVPAGDLREKLRSRYA